MEDGKQYMNSHDAKLYKGKHSEETSIQATRGGRVDSRDDNTGYLYPPKKIWSTERTLEVVKEAARVMPIEDVFTAISQSKGDLVLGQKTYHFSCLARKKSDDIANFHAMNGNKLPANKNSLNRFIAEQAAKKRATRWERLKGFFSLKKQPTLLKTH